MVDAINSGAKQVAEKLVNEATQAADSGAGTGQVAGGDQARFQQAMGGRPAEDGGDSTAAVKGASDGPAATPINANAAPRSPGESILAGIDRMRSGIADSVTGMQNAAAQNNLSQQDLMRAQMSMVRFTTTETVDSKVAGTAKSDLDKLLNS